MFADHYFEKRGLFVPLIQVPPRHETSMTVVIPCLAEPSIADTLCSLSKCRNQKGHTEVIVLINEPESCQPEISEMNHDTLVALAEWAGKNSGEMISYFPLGPVKLPSKWAGVGMARKTGMDEALYRFSQLERPDGIIISLDADTLVEENYLAAVEAFFMVNRGFAGATIAFSHQKQELNRMQLLGIELYEDFMHYYKDALAYTGYPHAIFTIGSAFAVTAGAYMRRGGMNRRKAGEDFYFLQTLPQVGPVGEINHTVVHPSARVSGRVPFGTGMTMKKWMDGSNDLLYAFNFNAFVDLKKLFSVRHLFFSASPVSVIWAENGLSESLSAFASENCLWQEIENLKDNCGSQAMFCSRFFQIFNAFRILKFLNFSHPRYYDKKLLGSCITDLHSATGMHPE